MAVPSLRIALLGVNYAPEVTGIAPYTTALAKGLHERGHDVRVFTSFPHYPEWRVPSDLATGLREEILDGVAVQRLAHYIPSKPSGVRRAAFELSFGARLLTASWTRADVVICVSPALLASAAALARGRVTRNRPALGLVVQDLYSRGVVETGLAGLGLEGAAIRLESAVLRASDGLVVIHDRFRERVIGRLGVPETQVSVIRNWTHIEQTPPFDIAAFRSSMGWGEDEVVVLHAGGMGAKQALENVVQAAKLADNQHERVRFVLLGAGSRRDALIRAAQGVRSVQFLEPVGDEVFGKMLRAADVLLVNEGVGVTEMAVPSKLTSYFSAGRPVVAATDEASITASELRASGGGLRVDPGQPDALLRTSVALGRNREQARTLGVRGSDYCQRILSAEYAIDRYEEWIIDLLARRATFRRSLAAG
jgi:colanic acid biosynthesis glycosyl transferase WcaI